MERHHGECLLGGRVGVCLVALLPYLRRLSSLSLACKAAYMTCLS